MSLRTARVVNLSPLSVGIDGTSVPIAAIVAPDPAALRASLAVGDRVGVVPVPGIGRSVRLHLIGKAVDA